MAGAEKRKNVFVDISSGCYVDAKMARRAVAALGARHVLYGSDGPYGTQTEDKTFDMKAEYEFATRLLPARVLDAVRKDNFERLVRKH